MYRKRRSSKREIAFSFDSFLDLVANVIGIIIRLLLGAGVGARTYQAAMENAAKEEPAQASAPSQLLPHDPLQRALDKTRQELEQARAGQLETLKALDGVKDEKTKNRAASANLSLAQQGLERD